MKNTTILLSLLLAVSACQKKETAASSVIMEDSSSAVLTDSVETVTPWVSDNQDFLDKFRTVEIDSSLFAPPTYEEGSIGKPLTADELKLLPSGLNTDSYIGNLTDFQAYTKFDIDANTLGLVLRTPGEYSFTALTLFFYDKKTDRILPKFFELADQTGDAGYSEKLTSWLIKDGNQLKSFSYHWTKVEKVEPDDPIRESRTDDYYLISLSPEKIDTARVSKNELSKYQHLLKQK